MKKILYFLVGTTPTTQEASDIAAFNAGAGKPYDFQVRNGTVGLDYVGNLPETADYAAGTVPTAYNALPVKAVADIPALKGSLPATQAIVSNGVDVVVPVTGVYVSKIKATIVAGVITGFVLS